MPFDYGGAMFIRERRIQAKKRRLTRLDREKRRERIIIGIFALVLVIAGAVVGWGYYQNYYNEHWAVIAKVNDKAIIKDDYNQRLKFS